jgi:hypothetical protein
MICLRFEVVPELASLDPHVLEQDLEAAYFCATIPEFVLGSALFIWLTYLVVGWCAGLSSKQSGLKPAIIGLIMAGIIYRGNWALLPNCSAMLNGEIDQALLLTFHALHSSGAGIIAACASSVNWISWSTLYVPVTWFLFRFFVRPSIKKP